MAPFVARLALRRFLLLTAHRWIPLKYGRQRSIHLMPGKRPGGGIGLVKTREGEVDI
jgi:hypothetical protein